jgi:alpha-D-ribose 1-methylphosphonate 5-triphosphate synthase subunit PhnG
MMSHSQAPLALCQNRKSSPDVTKRSWREAKEVVYYHRQLQQGKTRVSEPQTLSDQDRRRAAMAVLANTEAAAIDARLAALAVPSYETLREPECGLVMVRGRIGGDGAAFNLGEATVSRAAVRLASGELGIGYTLGRDRRKAELIALCDALIQCPDQRETVESHVVAPLRSRLDDERRRVAAETAATRVDFYTLVRGES